MINTGNNLPANAVITPQSIVADVLTDWPGTAPVFIKYHMSCVGCSMSGFETLADATRIYGIQIDRFLADLQATISLASQA